MVNKYAFRKRLTNIQNLKAFVKCLGKKFFIFRKISYELTTILRIR